MLLKYLQSRQNNKRFVQTNAHSHRCRLFQLTGPQATTAGPRCSESCRSVDCWTSPCNRRRKHSNASDQRKHITRHRLCSNSQDRKRRQLAHGARNRAGQLITSQAPAKSTKTTTYVQTNAHSHRCRLFQLTGTEATTAGPRCSESCRSVDCWTTTCVDDNLTSDHNTNTLPSLQSSHVAPGTCHTSARARCSRRKARARRWRTT